MSSKSHSPVVQEFIDGYPFPLDEFQIQAAEAIAAGRGVLVAAPTGSGKTVVGECAVFMAFRRGGSCFYTTPIKALSNQKFHDLVARYGEENVGLLTGDVSINGDAPIVVMTTEVLRNMIYADSHRLANLTHVVMDEVHYLADPSRGPVWEEAILNLAPAVCLVSLSATVSNVDEFGGWLNAVRGETAIITSDLRPVPLHQHMMVSRKIHPLFHAGPLGIQQPSIATFNKEIAAAVEHTERTSKGASTRRDTAITLLANANMLPAIFFIFSRSGCDLAVRQLLTSGLRFTNPHEEAEILRVVDAGVAGLTEQDLAVLGFRNWRRALSQGFAAHHAGMLPAFRHIVEELFSRGLLKVCFATETLALGINMPARTVVLERMVKFNGEAHVDLTPAQYTQLTGRAGRRGKDTTGNAVVLWSKGMDVYAVAELAATKTYPLDSTFRPGYNMAVNLIATKGLANAHRLLERSFAQYQINGSIVEHAQTIQQLQQEIRNETAELEAQLRLLPPKVTEQAEGNTLDLLLEFAELRRSLSTAQRQAKYVASQQRSKEIAGVLRSLREGDVIALPTGKHPLIAVVVKADSRPDNPTPVIITEEAWVERISAPMFGNTPMVIGFMKLPGGTTRNPRRRSRTVAAMLRRMQVERPRKLRVKARGNAPEVVALEEQLRQHPVSDWPNREALADLGRDLLKARRKLDFLQQETATSKDNLAHRFNQIVKLLGELDYLDIAVDEDGLVTDATITEEGAKLARIHHESDLFIAQCLRRGLWDELDPAALAGVVSACVFETRREVGVKAIFPDEATETAIQHMNRVYRELASDEDRHGIPTTRQLDLGFVAAIHQWTAGAPLEYCLAAAEAAGAKLSPGDFVRWCRQVIDLLNQLKQTGYSDEVKSAARRAATAINRGVVAIDAA